MVCRGHMVDGVSPLESRSVLRQGVIEIRIGSKVKNKALTVFILGFSPSSLVIAGGTDVMVDIKYRE